MLQPVRRGVDAGADWLMFTRRYEADTVGRIDLDELGLPSDERIYYLPTPWLAFRGAMSKLDIGPDDVFADIGSGKGRVVLMAAAYPFKRVIGVELSAELTEVARANVERNRDRLRARDVELVAADAVEWPIPDDLTVVYFYYPFFGSVFERVVERIVESYDRSPRRIRVVYNCPKDAVTLLRTGRFREVARLRTRYLSIYEVIAAPPSAA
jgi:SAM-dependent methyltransferase